jgi:hypothetical protein
MHLAFTANHETPGILKRAGAQKLFPILDTGIRGDFLSYGILTKSVK